VSRRNAQHFDYPLPGGVGGGLMTKEQNAQVHDTVICGEGTKS